MTSLADLLSSAANGLSLRPLTLGPGGMFRYTERPYFIRRRPDFESFDCYRRAPSSNAFDATTSSFEDPAGPAFTLCSIVNPDFGLRRRVPGHTFEQTMEKTGNSIVISRVDVSFKEDMTKQTHPRTAVMFKYANEPSGLFYCGPTRSALRPASSALSNGSRYLVFTAPNPFKPIEAALATSIKQLHLGDTLDYPVGYEACDSSGDPLGSDHGGASFMYPVGLSDLSHVQGYDVTQVTFGWYQPVP